MADDIVKEALEAFDAAKEAESDNRARMLADMRFVHLAEQWPEQVKRERERERRPCLTVNKLPAFVRQVVNDARQNRPQIKVTPVDSGADYATAEILSGLVRHIQRNSNADVAYDTAVEWAVGSGLGYFTVGTEYANDETFEQEIVIRRVVSPFSIYADPDSEAADSSDWRCAFQIVTGNAERLKAQYGVKELTSWADGSTGDLTADDKDEIRLAHYWCVEDEDDNLLMLSNGGAIRESQITGEMLAIAQAQGISVVEGKSRRVTIPKVRRHVLSGDEVLESSDWAGKYIPIIPVYGSEIWVENERVLKSLVNDAKDAQRLYNFTRSAYTELVALQPKAPFIGPKGFTKSSATKWKNANVETYPFLEYDVVDGQPPPQRQPGPQVPAGILQDMLTASDEMKAILGIYDASLGARSNETSGRAINARKIEADTSNYHFIYNLVRAIRHCGRILVDLIPAIYDTQRVVRIMGVDGTARQVVLNGPNQEVDETGQAIERIYDVTTGRYDVNVEAGPSFATQRQEAAAQMTELIRAFPQAAPVIGDLLAKNLDWPDADEVKKRLEKLTQGGGADPAQAMQEIQAAQQQVEAEKQAVEAGKQEIEKGKSDLQKMLSDLEVQQAKLQAAKAQLDADVAKAQAQLQQREQAVEVKSAMTDVRGQRLEESAQVSGAQTAQQIVQQALEAVAQRIGGIEQAIAKGQQSQPIVVPINQGAMRRRVKVSRAPTGELMGDIEDVADEV